MLTYKKIHIIQYKFTFIIIKIQDVSIIPCFNCERSFLKNNLNVFSKQLSKQLLTYFQIQIKPSSTSYICISCLYNISENKPPLY
jgi:hypothetical protein